MDTSSTSPASVFRSEIEAYAAADADGILAHFTKDGELTDMSRPFAPYSGKAAIRGFLNEYFASITELRPEITSLVHDDKKVAAEMVVTAKYADPASAAGGRPITIHYCLVNTIENGLITSERFYWDPNQLEAQLTAETKG